MSIVQGIILTLFCGCAIAQLLYWLIFFPRIAFKKNAKLNQGGNTLAPPVSVVICAFNEAENLTERLQGILEQDYPNFEVLVVDDGSTDETLKVVRDFQGKFEHLQVLRLDYKEGEKGLGKKTALSNGIKSARHDLLLLTDADCSPTSKYWIKEMVQCLGENDVALGYGPYEYRPGVLNAFVRFEALYTAIQYMAFAEWGLPYMGVGRNLMYRKSLFFKVGGFESHKDVASGDDDLFINQVSNKNNTITVLSRNTFMYSPPKETFAGYFRQKSRHVTTGKKYRRIHQFMLGALSFSHAGFYLFGIAALLMGSSIIFVGISLLLMMFLKLIVFGSFFEKTDEKRLIPLIPLLDVFFVAYYFTFMPALLRGKTGQWK